MKEGPTCSLQQESHVRRVGGRVLGETFKIAVPGGEDTIQDLSVVGLHRPVFGDHRLSDITPEAIEHYLSERLTSGRKVRTKLSVHNWGTIRAMTVHQEFRVLAANLNVAVKQKRLTTNPCSAVEFPVA